MKPIDIQGKRFGLLTAVRTDSKDKFNNRIWTCKCDCGGIAHTTTNKLLKGHTQSCGCISRSKTRERNYKHGYAKTPLYNVWKEIKQRCCNNKHKSFHRYGGRGIVICEQWKNDYNTFHTWAIDNGYKNGLSIDRINNNGNYEPSNCRWTTYEKQANNRRTARLISYKGETHTLTEWSNITSIPIATIHERLKRGVELSKVFNK